MNGDQASDMVLQTVGCRLIWIAGAPPPTCASNPILQAWWCTTRSTVALLECSAHVTLAFY